MTAQNWEAFWATLPANETFPWNRPPGDWFTQAAAHVVDNRPVIDVPCGNGLTTWWLAAQLASRVPKIVGLDVSESALDRAAAFVPPPSPRAAITFQPLDLLDTTAVNRMGIKLGPATVWTRFLLHLLDPDDQRRVVRNLAQLAGDTGVIINYELLHQNPRTIELVVSSYPTLRNSVFAESAAGLRVGQLWPGTLAALYSDAGLRIVETGRDTWTTDTLDGPGAQLGCEWVIARL